jgi:hypothetical protein
MAISHRGCASFVGLILELLSASVFSANAPPRSQQAALEKVFETDITKDLTVFSGEPEIAVDPTNPRNLAMAILDIFPCGTPRQVAAKLKGFCDAGMRVFKVFDYGAMAGLKFSATTAAKVREAEDELPRLVGSSAEQLGLEVEKRA